MHNFQDLTGQTFNRLTVVSKGETNGKRTAWECLCQCGNTKTVLAFQLKNGNTKSCGCLNSEMAAERLRTHGKRNAAIYAIWNNMMSRCHNPKDKAFSNYGGRGIAVCDEWHTFEGFYADMGDKPEGMSMERIDNNGNYEPGNVEWKTAKEQANNRRSNVLLTYQGQTKNVQQWCDELGLNAKTVRRRLNVYGYSVEQALRPERRGKHVCSE